jgi:hypothetical protein
MFLLAKGIEFIAGTLPVSWGEMAAVEELMLMYNNFTGNTVTPSIVSRV